MQSFRFTRRIERWIGSFLIFALVLVSSGFGSFMSSASAASSWSPVTSNSSVGIYGGCYGNGHYVGVGQSGEVVTSSDGTTWTSQTVGTDDLLRCTYQNGKFLAVGYGTPHLYSTGASMYSSADGLAWTAVTIPDTESIFGIAFNGTTYVTVGTGGKILTSSNGTTWSSMTPFTSQDLNDVVFGGNRFVAVGANGGVFVSNNGGVSWASQSVGSSTNLHGVAYDGSLQYVAVGDDGIYLSTDAVSWTKKQSTSDLMYGVTYGGGQFVASGLSGLLYTSADGISWTSETFDASQMFYSVFAGGTKYVAVGESGYLATKPMSLSLSNDASLSNLTVSQGALTPNFDSGTPTYTVSVGNAVTNLTVTPTVSNSHATVK
ncbi:cadherin-like beta sandwich domain-containing protein, partial [Tumebacillus sp. ITR2]